MENDGVTHIPSIPQKIHNTEFIVVYNTEVIKLAAPCSCGLIV